MSSDGLDALLRPRGIAVVGASAEPNKFSSRLIPSLQAMRYPGGIYPVNPRYPEVAGLPCYPDIGAVPDPCDLAIVAVPARYVQGVLEAAADRGIGAAVVLSAGFDELGPAGQERAEALRRLSGRIRIYGPNCPGLWQIQAGLVYTFSTQFDPAQLRAGPVGLVSQGGALGRAVLDAMPAGVGFSAWYSTGNEIDLQAGDFVALLADDPATKVVAVLVEGLRDGRRFAAAVRRCVAGGKPVVVCRLGRSRAGAAAARAHTAAPGCDDLLAQTALADAGCRLVDDVDELVAAATLLGLRPQPPAGGVGVCTFSGGSGVLLADQAERQKVVLPPLAPPTAAALTALLPEIAAVGNPTDLTTAALEDPGLARKALEVMAADPGLACVVFSLPHRHDGFDARMAGHLVELAATAPVPLLVVAHSPGFAVTTAAERLREAAVPVFPSAHLAAVALRVWLAGRAADVPRQAGSTGAGGASSKDAVGLELWARLAVDPGFGPYLACGLGGAWGAVCPEEQRALAPLAAGDGAALVDRMRCGPLLAAAGVRGELGAALEAWSRLRPPPPRQAAGVNPEPAGAEARWRVGGAGALEWLAPRKWGRDSDG